MSSGLAKRAQDHIPYCEDQGIPYVTGAAAAGVAIQFASLTTDAAPDTFVFLTEGLMNMANATYDAIAINKTAAARPTVVSARTNTQFVITGHNGGDVLTVIITGQLAGQTA